MKILFTTIVGRPNTGKSSLINQLIGYDLNIVSAKPQATRNDVTGIYSDENHQIIFTDTPGIHSAESEFTSKLNTVALKTLEDIDLAIFMSPANEYIGENDLKIIQHLDKVENKIAIISKVDLENNFEVLKERAEFLKSKNFKEVFAISTKDPSSIEKLMDEIKKYSYEGEPPYETEYITTSSERFLVQEYIREAAGEFLQHELPHSILVEVTSFKEVDQEDNRFALIDATIYVKKDSQKGIVIGANGTMIKKIGQLSRKKIKEKLDLNNQLFLNVKVKKNWVNDKEFIKKLGY